MATLYVENVPEEVYAALRKRARQHRKSIAAEILSMLEENIATPAELKRRRDLLRVAKQLRSKRRAHSQFPSAEEMQREDRER